MTTIAAPHMVLSAFASELYLKCLLCLEKGSVPQTHNLKALFRDISTLAKKRIEQIWDAYAASPGVQELWKFIESTTGKPFHRDFAAVLERSSTAFNELRYLHEDNSGSFLAGDLPQMLRTVILERRPLWATLRHTPPTSHPRGKPVPSAKSA